MTRWQRARWALRLRNVRYAVLGFYRSITFPVRHPLLWLLCRYCRVFYGLYYAGRPDLAVRFGRIWPSRLSMVVGHLREQREPVPVVFP